MIKDKKLKLTFAVFGISLFLIWAVLEMLIIPLLETNMTDIYIQVIKEIVLKILIWLIPAIILVKKLDEKMYIKSSEFFKFRPEFLKFIPIFLLFTAFHLISDYVQEGKISISETFSMADILIACSVGISEEMVFRGFLLNSTYKDDKKAISVGFNAFLFLAIHFPVWIRTDMFMLYITSGSFIQIMLLSVIFSYSFIKSRSIVVPAFLHMYWDFLCFLL